MVEAKLPYLAAYGNITKTLSAIQKASTPERFTQDFLATKLNLKGGGPKPVIPFLKRTGFLNSDGSPTEIYKRFRNPSDAGAAAAIALKHGFAPLYEINEYTHDLSDSDLRGVITQATGAEKDSVVAKNVFGSFKALRAFADFDAAMQPVSVESETDAPPSSRTEGDGISGLRLGYTINLNLPATSDVAVFNAIFKSLRENLLH